MPFIHVHFFPSILDLILRLIGCNDLHFTDYLGTTHYLTFDAWPHYFFWSMYITLPAITDSATVYPKKYAHGFVVLCFVVVMQSFIMNSHEVFIHIHQGCFAGTGAIVRLPQCQWSKPDGYGKISQCITTTKHSKAKNRVHISRDIL